MDKYKAIVQRAAWTFLQAFLAAWVATGLKLDKITLVAAAAAGLSALKNIFITPPEVK